MSKWRKPSGSEVYEIVRGPTSAEIIAKTSASIKRSQDIIFLVKPLDSEQLYRWRFWITQVRRLDTFDHNLILAGEASRDDGLDCYAFTAHYNATHYNGYTIIATTR